MNTASSRLPRLISTFRRFFKGINKDVMMNVKKIIVGSRGSFIIQTSAENGVINMTNPADGPFTVTSGNISIH